MSRSSRRLETLAIHGAGGPDPETGAVTPPIHPATTFERNEDGSYPRGYVYSRLDNPNRAALEQLLAALEGGREAAAFASGSAAAAAVFRSLRPGDTAIIPDDMYHGLRRLLRGALEPAGVNLAEVDMTDLGALESKLGPSVRLVWVETPSNPMLKISDLAGVVERARAVGAAVACDATWTPPGVQSALDLGVDLVVHATTKYLAGHSDVLGGAVVTGESNELFERVRFLQRNEGAVPSPFDCWLTLRGLKTLPYRVRGQVANAGRLAAFLASDPRVRRVYYPGLADHPGHEVAARQMDSFGAMLSFVPRGGEARAMAVAARLRVFTRATSLGGVESLVEHRASIEGPESATPRDLLRVSVGLEHIDDLLADLDGALRE